MRAELLGALPALGPGQELDVPSPSWLARYAVSGGEVLAGWSGVGRGPTERLVAALTGEPGEPDRASAMG